MNTMKKKILIIALTVVIMNVIFLLFIFSGIYNVSQLSPHNSLVRWMINKTKDRSIHSRIEDIKVPPLNDCAMEVSGFKNYSAMCMKCHGAPGEEMGELTQGLTPKPPRLFEHAKELEPNEAFWVVKNGIKFTAMPAFGPTHSDEDIWNIVAFLKNKLVNMSPDEYKQWKQQYPSNHPE